MPHILIIGASQGVELEMTREALDTVLYAEALARSNGGGNFAHRKLEQMGSGALISQDVEIALNCVETAIQGLKDRTTPCTSSRMHTDNGQVR